MELRLQLDAATPTPLGMVYGKGMVLTPAPCNSSRSWYRLGACDWECDEGVILYPRSLTSIPLLYIGTIPRVKLLESWPSGKGTLS